MFEELLKQELGLIRRVGARKNGHWELTKQ